MSSTLWCLFSVKICTKCQKYYDSMVLWLVVARYLHIWWCIMVTKNLRSLKRYMSCSHRGLRHTEGFSVVKACSRYRAIYWESCLTITRNILFLGNGTFIINFHALFSFFNVWFQRVLQEDIFIGRKIPYILKNDWIVSIFVRSEFSLPHCDMYTSFNMF